MNIEECRKRVDFGQITPGWVRALIGTIERERAEVERMRTEPDRLRFAALMAYGVRGGPGAWRWASDPMGTTLDTETAWERMLSEMRAARGGGEAPPCYRCGTVDEPRAEVTLCGDCMPEPRAHEAPPAPPDDLCPRCREFNCTPECIASDGTFDDGPRPMKFS